MRIPRYWARTDGSETGRDGKRYAFQVWGWSHESTADALATARKRLSEIAGRIAGGAPAAAGYFYGRQPLREEIVRLIGDPDTAGEAVVTRNRYGALVLNTARVPFIDVDVPEAPAGAALRRLLSLSRRPATDPTLDRIRQACQLNSRYAFRLYRTRGRYRLLATNVQLDPRADATQSLMSSFGADASFITLCRAQGSFCARLTPKPWRCECPLPPGQFPRQDAQARERFAKWLTTYETASAPFATCKYLESTGSGLSSSETRGIIEEHDRATRALEDRPLA